MIKTILKIAFSAGIVIWLTTNGHLDFSLVLKSLKNPLYWVVAFLLMACNGILISYRWKLLLQVKSKVIFPLKKIAGLTWISLFFSTFLPGAVTGDIIKLVYAKDLDRSLSNSFLISSALLDRILGLFGLITLMSITSITYYSELITLAPSMEGLLKVNLLLCFGMIVFYILLFLPSFVQSYIILVLKLIPKLGNKLAALAEDVWLIGRDKKAILKASATSILTQTANLFAFWLITMPFYSVEIPFKYAITFIPLGLISIAIPISPAGMGVGHAAFSGLFQLIGETGGASLFNIYFIAIVTFNLFGTIPYILIGKRKKN